MIITSHYKSLKRFLIYFLVAFLFFSGHYYVYNNPISNLNMLSLIPTSGLACICLFGAIFLFSGKRRMRARMIFVFQLVLVGLAAIYTMNRAINFPEVANSNERLITTGMMIYGSVYAFILLLYPFELLSPGRKSFWHYFVIFLPVPVLSFMYYLYLHYSGVAPTEAVDMNGLMSQFSRLDIWFCFLIFIYPIGLFVLILTKRRRYVGRRRRNLTNLNYINPEWLNYYLFGYFLILISSMIVVLLHNTQSLLMHGFAVLFFFAFTLFNILRQEEPMATKVPAEQVLDEADMEPAEGCCAVENPPPSRAG